MGEDKEATNSSVQVKSPENFPNNEKIALWKGFVEKGFDLIKAGKYQEAVTYFDDRTMAERLDFELLETPTDVVIGKPLENREAEREVFTELRMHCGVNYPNGGKGEISLSHLSFLPGLSLRGKNTVSPEMTNSVALVYAEEWIHVGQILNGNKGISLSMKGQDIFDHIISHKDLNFYFSEHNVPLTEMYRPTKKGK